MTWTKLTSIEKVRDQIDTIEKLWTKLKYGVKDRDQLCNLSFFFNKGKNLGTLIQLFSMQDTRVPNNLNMWLH